MLREDSGELVDACQDAKRPCGRTDDSSRGFVHVVQTRAQKRTKAHSPVASEPASEPDSEFEDASSPVQRGKRHRHHDSAMNQSLETWTPAFLTEKQGEDSDLELVKSWLESSAPPDWNEIRGESPSLKAYQKQFDSLILKKGVIYRRLESLFDPPETRSIVAA